jgi:GNAT superfamily N-acetyltransferase
MLQIVRVINELPEGFGALLADAQAEGVRNMTLLAEQWASGDQRFDAGGAALFAAFVGGELAGVGGASPEAAEAAMRMRRLYVRPRFRRSGVGRALAGAMMQQGLESARVLTVNARASEAARPFWEAMGFVPVEAAGYTHQLAR